MTECGEVDKTRKCRCN